MDSECDIYDAIVVGAGIEGSSAAYNLVNYGKRTLLLDQFPLPHCRGSSHGQTRITRRDYGLKDHYASMMKEAFEMTEELEKQCGEKLFINCGYLAFGPSGTSGVTHTEKCLSLNNVPYEKFDAKEQRRRYPHLLFPDDHVFILEKTGGILLAEKMLRAFQSEFVRCGGVINCAEPMVDLIPGQIVSVKTNKATYKARSVVLTMGAWAAKFLPRIGINVPLQAEKISVCYWKTIKDDEGETFNYKTFPTFFTETAAGKYIIYGLPEYEYPGLVKICLHDGPNVDPDNTDGVDSGLVLETMKHVIATHFPTLEKEPHIVEACIYTRTPDKDFIIDVHPVWNNVVIGAGFSGHGFKLSPVVGKLLAQLATGQQMSYDVSHFRISRFFKNKL